MNDGCKVNFGKNLTLFRRLFDMSQEDLAEKLNGVNQQTLSKYENFCGNPKIETIQDCANLFGISIDALVNKDLSKEIKDEEIFQLDMFTSDFLVKANKLKRMICPILKGRDVDNDLFNKAITLHEELIDEIYEPCYDVKFEKCMCLYEKCYENGICEALANMISLSILNQMKQSQTYEQKMALNEYMTDRMSAKNFMRECAFNNCRDKTSDFCDRYDVVMKLILKLKKSPEWRDVADFYMATEYFLGMVANNKSVSENQMIGLEMIRSLVVANNDYILRTKNCEITSI